MCGATTRISARADHSGRLARFSVVGGNIGEVRSLIPLLEGVPTGELITDAAYDAEYVREYLSERGIVATIRPLPQRRLEPDRDRASYARRHLAENLFSD